VIARFGHAPCACTTPGARQIPSDNTSPPTRFIAISFVIIITVASKFFAVCPTRAGVARVERERNPGAALPTCKKVPDFAALNPGYVAWHVAAWSSV
jgi:hypothetical protein